MAEKTASPSMGWVVTLGGLGINLALGVLYTWSVVTATLTKALDAGGKYGWKPLDALVPYAIALLAFGIMMAFAGRLQDKYGPKLIASIGGLFVGAGMIMSSFNDMSAKGNHMLITVGFGLLAGMGIGLAYACATPAAVKWFHPSQKGLIAGLVVAGFGLASVYTAPLTSWLILTQGVAGMFRVLGIAFTISILICAQLLQNPPAGYVCKVPAKVAAAAASSNAPAAAPARDYTWQEMVKTPQFFLLWLMYACAAFAGLMMVGIVSKVATDFFGAAGTMVKDPTFATYKTFGLALGKAYWFTVALAIGNGLGRPFAGILSDSIGRVRTMIGVFLIQAVLVGWAVGASSSVAMLLVVGALIGAMYGANLTLFPATTYDFFGLKNGGVNYGIVFTAWGVGGCVGNYIAGFAKTFWGGFTPAYYIAAALCVLAAVLAVAVKEPKHATENVAAEHLSHAQA